MLRALSASPVTGVEPVDQAGDVAEELTADERCYLLEGFLPHWQASSGEDEHLVAHLEALISPWGLARGVALLRRWLRAEVSASSKLLDLQRATGRTWTSAQDALRWVRWILYLIEQRVDIRPASSRAVVRPGAASAEGAAGHYPGLNLSDLLELVPHITIEQLLRAWPGVKPDRDGAMLSSVWWCYRFAGVPSEPIIIGERQRVLLVGSQLTMLAEIAANLRARCRALALAALPAAEEMATRVRVHLALHRRPFIPQSVPDPLIGPDTAEAVLGELGDMVDAYEALSPEAAWLVLRALDQGAPEDLACFRLIVLAARHNRLLGL